MTAPITIIDEENGCYDCGGIKFYRASRKCVRCSYHERIKTIAARKHVALVRKDDGTFGLEDLRKQEFMHAERRIFAGVKYSNMERIYE